MIIQELIGERSYVKLDDKIAKDAYKIKRTYFFKKGQQEKEKLNSVFGYSYTVRLPTHVHCKPTHFVFHSFIAKMSYSLQTSFNSLMKDWGDKYHVWGTPTRSPSRSNSR